jgi:hypothetical protein
MILTITLAGICAISCVILFVFFNRERQERLDAQAKIRALSDYITSLEEAKATKKHK